MQLNKNLKYFAKWTAKHLAIFLLLLLSIVVLCMSACSTKPYIVSSQSEEGIIAGEPTKVYVVSHGWHTGFVVPSKDIKDKVPALKKRFPNTSHIEFGWGDKGFYQSKEITTGLTLRAVFLPTESVVHAVAVPKGVKGYFSGSQVQSICLNNSGYRALTTFIANSFAKDEAGKSVSQKKGIYGNSQFYTGVGNYYLMNTCNKWTAKGLKSAGVDISTVFKLTASSVMNAAEKYSKEINRCAQIKESALAPKANKKIER